MNAFLSICLVLSLIGMFTTKPVSELIGPKGSGGPGDFLRVFVSVTWFAFGGLICLVAALFFGLLLALVN